MAAAILIQRRESIEFEDFVGQVRHLDVSLPSIEIVHRIATFVDSSHVYTYIANGISECERERDSHLQNRKVMLVWIPGLTRQLCKLITSVELSQSLLLDMKIEIESFCIRFAKIKEVADLYRQLKQRERV